MIAGGGKNQLQASEAFFFVPTGTTKNTGVEK